MGGSKYKSRFRLVLDFSGIISIHFHPFMDTFGSIDVTDHGEASIGKRISSEGGWRTIMNIVLLTVATGHDVNIGYAITV